MAKKKEPEVGGFVPDPNPEEVLTIEYNPATDPNKTAQERLDALTAQHAEMHRTREHGKT